MMVGLRGRGQYGGWLKGEAQFDTWVNGMGGGDDDNETAVYSRISSNHCILVRLCKENGTSCKRNALKILTKKAACHISLLLILLPSTPPLHPTPSLLHSPLPHRFSPPPCPTPYPLPLTSPLPLTPPQYKYPDGSVLERDALYSNYKELVEANYELSFYVPLVSHTPGSDITLEVHITNSGGKRPVEVVGHVTCSAVMYTGKILRGVDKKVVRQKVGVGATEVVKMGAGERILAEFPGERAYLMFDILLAHNGSVQVFEHKVYVGPTVPKMEVTLSPSSHLGLGEEAKVTVQFTNPLPFKMDAVSLNVENDNLLHGNHGN